MDKINEYLDKIIATNDKKAMEEIGEMFVEMAEYIEDINKDSYKNICTRMYELAYGKTLNKEMAEEWVRKMIPGPKWSFEETTQAMRNMGYNFNPIDFYIVSNMMYSDNYDLVKDNETLALKLAKNWLCDKDVGENKLYNYYKYVI